MIELIDDGTLDTVFSLNGVWHRYNYAYSEFEGNYDSFIEWCTEDIKNGGE